MGNGFGKISGCFWGRKRERHDIAVLISEPLDEGLGHSFCYIRPATSLDDYCHQEEHENVCSLKVLQPAAANTALTHQPRLSSSKVYSDESKKYCVVPETTTFKSISGASVSANTSTPLTGAPLDQYNSFAYVSYDRAAAFESTNSFSAIPLQPVPRGLSNSGPLIGTGFLSGPLERGFLSGPLERGFLSGPLERGFGSGPLDKGYKSGPIESIERSLSSGPLGYPYFRRKLRRNSLSRVLRDVSGPLKKIVARTISKTALSVSRGHRSLVTPLKTSSPKGLEGRDWAGTDRSGDIYSINLSSELSLDDTASDSMESQNLQWAQGKAGEDRVHVVISEEHGWLFVGIYDGFNGPDAPDYLLSNLYPSIHRELKGLIWDRAGAEKSKIDVDPPKQETILSKKERKDGRELEQELHCCSCNDELGVRADVGSPTARLDETGDRDIAGKQNCLSDSNVATDLPKGLNPDENLHTRHQSQGSGRGNNYSDACRCKETLKYQKERNNQPQGEGDDKVANKKSSKHPKSRIRGMSRKWKESQRKWKHDWDLDRLELQQRLKEDLNTGYRENDPEGALNHFEVLKALARALNKTEEAYLEMADKAVAESPELALMGSCVLVMLMKGEDVYVMNVGDSRAILAQKLKPDLGDLLSKSQTIGESIPCRDLERISEETSNDLEAFDNCSYDPINMDRLGKRPTLGAVQLSLDHSTSVEEEVRRIKEEHLDDVLSITNDRVKGTLKVTRAFGAGFLKQPKWNNALLEVFKIDYVGTAPYITCTPALYHHRLGPQDHFLILSSDGLYQYFSNEEVVNHVEWFMSSFPDGDPAQHLVEEVLFRAAKKAGMDFHELLEIPQGDRRKYHDDVSVMVVSLEGRIWKSSV